MQVTLLPAPDASLADLVAASRGGPRTPSSYANSGSIHESEVVDALFKLQHPGMADPDNWEWASILGFLLEDVWEFMWAQMMLAVHPEVIRPGEFDLDGLFLSPDGICMEPDLPEFPRPRLVEYKFTWKSVTGSPPEQNWKWRMQTMSYLHCLHLTDCELVALYPLGNYRPPKPVLRRELWVFEQEELDAAWRMLCDGAEWLRRQQGNGVAV